MTTRDGIFPGQITQLTTTPDRAPAVALGKNTVLLAHDPTKELDDAERKRREEWVAMVKEREELRRELEAVTMERDELMRHLPTMERMNVVREAWVYVQVEMMSALGDKLPQRWHQFVRALDSLLSPDCWINAKEPVDIDALGAEIDAAEEAYTNRYGRLESIKGRWASWIRKYPAIASGCNENTNGLLPFILPFVDRISAAGAQVIAQIERNTTEESTAIKGAP